jgi:glycosyltransferase involved in cell wall biosynthesis
VPGPPDLSVVIPVLDEEESLTELHAELRRALDGLKRASEIVFVDDGSTDATSSILRDLAAHDRRVTVVRLRSTVGQTAALSAGFDHARGSIIATMDADLQDDPAEIRVLLARMADGCDAVCGWRRTRRDRLLDRSLPSLLANRLIARATGVAIHDNGCGLKTFRREVIAHVRPRMRDGMHRFLMVLSAQAGARVAEVVVRHRPRRFGRSKYGLSRVPRFLRDLAVVTLGPSSGATDGGKCRADYVVREVLRASESATTPRRPASAAAPSTPR